MATSIGHAIAGACVARAGGGSGWQVAGAALLANVPDLDLWLGWALRGDTAAFHRSAWSHSPQAAIGVGVLVGLVRLGSGLHRREELSYRSSLRLGLLTALVLLTHPLLDYWLVNPLTIDLEGLRGVKMAAASLANWLTDILLYGAMAIVLLTVAGRWRRRWAEKPYAGKSYKK